MRDILRQNNFKNFKKRRLNFMGRYDYEDLRKQAIENPTFENLEALANWLETYDMSS
jgi:hypothetical protein